MSDGREVTAITCTYCGSTLAEDRGEIAPGISDFECESCERRFYVIEPPAEPQRIEQDERSIEGNCPTCGRPFDNGS